MSDTDYILAAMEKRRKRLEIWLKSSANKGPIINWPKRKLMEKEIFSGIADYTEIPIPEPYPEPEP